MCLILFAIQPDTDYQLVVAANRDEFYERPTQIADFWKNQPHILAGKDLEMGGTWLGITKTGRFAAVTNFRETPISPPPPRSRGDLTLNFLLESVTAAEYLEALKGRANEYRGFNLLLGDQAGYYYYSNRADEMLRLDSGYYGLSNQLLNCKWPKVIHGKDRLKCLSQFSFNREGMFDLLSDEGSDQAFSSSFISSAEYGTCASTLVTVKRDGNVYFEERNFAPGGVATLNNQFSFNTGA